MTKNHNSSGEGSETNEGFDSFSLGRRLRFVRKQQGLTLNQVADKTGIAISQLSLLENGKRDAKMGTLHQLADAYERSVEDLLATVPSKRDQLEIELDRLMRSPVARAKGLPPLRISPQLDGEVLEALVRLYRELEQDAAKRVATPEAARRVNTELRQEMRSRDNYFWELEQEAQKLLGRVDYQRGPLAQHHIGALAEHLGFTLHHVADLPHSTRSVTDLKHMRIYLSGGVGVDKDPRSVLLQALGHHVLGHAPPSSYGDFLRQRVETNYFAAALLMPEMPAVEFLQRAKERRELAIEDLRDAFAVSYQAAAHRFTNLATRHLGLRVHFHRVHESGIIYKAYENDGLAFPTDDLGAVEGQPACRYWTARQVFNVADRFNAFHQFIDTSDGTFWCTARVESTPSGAFSTGIGVRYKDSKWFRGRDTKERAVSQCPDPNCCRRAPEGLASRWADHVWPSSRTHAHLLAALPPGTFPGVDDTEVFEFLEGHS